MTWGDKAIAYVVLISLMHITQVSWWWLFGIVFLHVFLDAMEEEYLKDSRKEKLKEIKPSEN